MAAKTSAAFIGLFLALVAAHAAADTTTTTTNTTTTPPTKAVEDFCNNVNTRYHKSCLDSLANASSLNTSAPIELLRASLNTAIQQLNVVTKQMDDLKLPETFDVCRKMVVDSMDDLQNACEALNDPKLNPMGDLKVRIEGALTYLETCTDDLGERQLNDGIKQMQGLVNFPKEIVISGMALSNDQVLQIQRA